MPRVAPSQLLPCALHGVSKEIGFIVFWYATQFLKCTYSVSNLYAYQDIVNTRDEEIVLVDKSIDNDKN